MRQHVNPLSKNFHEMKAIPPFNEIFKNPNLPLHLDIGCAAGDFLFDLALRNQKWNYLGIEIREKLVINANLRMQNKEINNLYFAFGNANKISDKLNNKLPMELIRSITFNFPDPWFKKKHHKRRVIQPDYINYLSDSIQKGTLIFIKTDVKDLFEYMKNTILNNINFKKVENKDWDFANSFNPFNIQTNREKYAISNKLEIYQEIFIRI